MASEVGVLDIPPEDVLVKERLHPGRIFLVDTAKGRIVDDDEIKRELAAQHPYREWLDSNLVDINDLPPARAEQPDHETVLKPAAGVRLHAGRPARADRADGDRRQEPVGSMGTDTSLAVLSGQAAAALRLFQAAVRAGDEPAARRHSRGTRRRRWARRSAPNETC